jgi:hypothetical protein
VKIFAEVAVAVTSSTLIKEEKKRMKMKYTENVKKKQMTPDVVLMETTRKKLQ